jgi:DMSO reductase family type II enzyme chaperone
VSEILEHLSTPEQEQAAARSRGYRILAAAFDYPEGEMGEAIRSGEIAQALREGLGAVDPALGADVAWDELCDAGNDDDLAVEFTRLFDVGTSGPPCPLYGGLYGGARMKVMEEAVRFYNHFGLHLDERQRELPDHLQTALEFLHYLAFRETEALVQGEDPGAYRRAQRDFLARHPGRWVPLLKERLEQHEPMPYFRVLVALLARFLERDLRHLVAVSQAAPLATSHLGSEASVPHPAV